MADEALASFQLLLEVVPGWINDLENILSSATQQQTALIIAQQPAEILPESPSKSASGSLQSNHSLTGALNDAAPLLLQQQLPHLTGPDHLRLSQRKRKTASVCSRVNSQRNEYRSRGSVAIYYDGVAQKDFERLVRAIGTSRNSIRKSKLSMKIDSLARTGSSSSSCSNSGEEVIKGLGTFTYRTTTTLRRPSPGAPKEDSTTAFDEVDGALEKAQMFCERAAHQILRDGDCGIEITKAKEHFAAAIDTINAELPGLTKKAKKALDRKAAEDQKYGLEDPWTRDTAGSPDGHSFPSDGVLEVDTDEIAGDSESEDFDISTMKLPSRLEKFTNGQPHLPTITAVH
ncbi:hypothetical protein AMS68_004595 [Peltaster fructicola]|uniref:Uncharacterized protein n=1 Tax=Peltaster fructicola TaxID=286661 RepID=A0A6H0XWV2_9PEZI|nr:hypothetical protein AMS68_004595 [Peltaster fructicola]